MKVVIQCAAGKQPDAKTFIAADGRRVAFVAHPELAPRDAGILYARPDDVYDDGQSWRKRLLAYNEELTGNPLGFLQAYRLYHHNAYRVLVERFGLTRVFVLSAGWGLIPAAFLIPDYDITFSASADPWKRRHKEDRYDDFRMIADDEDQIVFVGGKDYLPLFCHLTAPLRGAKTVFFNSRRRPDLPHGFTPIPYSTKTRTNWHYECALDLAAGKVHLGS
jgi:hypothetical protein